MVEETLGAGVTPVVQSVSDLLNKGLHACFSGQSARPWTNIVHCDLDQY
jgi:hypothetical protein